MALSPAALAGIYHALMGMAPDLTGASLPTSSVPTVESMQQQAMIQELAIQAGAPGLPSPAQIQQAALQMSLAGALQQQTEGMAAPVAGAVVSDGSTGIPFGYQILGEFVGTIHAYDEVKGFGFVTCDDLRKAGHTKDPFLLRSQLNDCKQGDHINFRAVVNDKDQLQAWTLTKWDGVMPEGANLWDGGVKRTFDEAGLTDPDESLLPVSQSGPKKPGLSFPSALAKKNQAADVSKQWNEERPEWKGWCDVVTDVVPADEIDKWKFDSGWQEGGHSA